MEGIQNYYEIQITAQLEMQAQRYPELSDDDLSDIACLALNQLPSRYFKHGVDLSYYTSPDEQTKVNKRIDDALEFAIEHVRKNPRH